MYCTNCGREGLDHHAYCTGCGHSLNTVQQYSPAANLLSERIPWRGGQVALGILLVVAALVPLTVLAVSIGDRFQGEEDAWATWLSSHFIGAAILVVVWILALNPYQISFSSFGLEWPKFPKFRTILLVAAALLASLAASWAYLTLVEALGWDVASNIDADIAFPGAAAIFTFQALALVTPITEEIFFRGFVFSGLIHRLGPGKAIIASAVVFGVFHLSIEVLVPIFITGLLFAWLYRQTGSLWPCIAAHAGQNALAVAAQIYVM